MTSPNQQQTSGGADGGRSDNKIRVLRLPDESLLESRAIDRTLRIALGVFAALLIAGMLAATLVRMDIAVEAVGRLEPSRVTPVRTLIAGVVREVRVQSGGQVRRGDTLALLDDVDLLAQRRTLELAIAEGVVEDRKARTGFLPDSLEAIALLDAAEARLLSARAQLQRRVIDYGLSLNIDSLLRNFKPGTHIGVDEAVAGVKTAQADVRSAQAKLRALSLRGFDSSSRSIRLARARGDLAQAGLRHQRSVILAPVSGLVSTDSIERIQGAQIREGDMLFEIVEASQWRVIARVAETDVAEIRAGQKAVIEIAAIDISSRRQFDGRVAYIASEATATSSTAPIGTGMYRVVIDLDPQSTKDLGVQSTFRRGFTARARIISYRDRAYRVLLRKLRRSFST